MPATRILTEAELRTFARQLVSEAGLTQMQVAEKIGVRQSIVSRALSDVGDRRYVNVLSSIVASLTGSEVDGPLYRVYHHREEPR